MRFNASKFFLDCGIRKPTQLETPRLSHILNLNLPFESIYHFIDPSAAVLGPNPQDPIFQIDSGRLFLENVVELADALGNPRRTSNNPATLDADFKRKNRIFKPLRKDAALVINQRNVLVFNYNLLNSLFRYIATFKTTYYRWHNNAKTLWRQVQDASDRFGWNQYIELPLPPTLPTVEDFNRLNSEGFTQNVAESFPTGEYLNLADIYNWCGVHRELSNLKDLDLETLRKTNLIIKAGAYFTVLNLGVLNSWRKNPEAEKSTAGIEPKQLSLRFLRLLYLLKELDNGAAQLTTDDEGGQTVTLQEPVAPKPIPAPNQKTSPELTEETEQAVEDSVKDEDPELEPLPDFDFELPEETPEEDESTFDIAADDDDDDDLEMADADIEAEFKADADFEYDNDSLTEGVQQKAADLADAGIITPRAYRRALEDAMSYKHLDDPFGTGKTLEEAMSYSPEDFELPPQQDFPDKDTIIDKTMLSSKLKSMNRKYVGTLLRKDVLQSVMAIQNFGIAVKDYQVETVRDAMNHYEIHRVTVKPVRGRQSTLTFRYPVVDKDGRYISNGTSYKLKMQRAD